MGQTVLSPRNVRQWDRDDHRPCPVQLKGAGTGIVPAPWSHVKGAGDGSVDWRMVRTHPITSHRRTGPIRRSWTLAAGEGRA